ncbi:uncharacterized protein LOC130665224 [Microplitis mediator]|uniref:uncharacterized protein LOC130665224 n=1 Tax=Microplitis mediator TaxID=375433 RepID=UPI00255435A2|nr:uncharacterized protein LOC130665224 [Microplitis mediator]
MDSYTSCIKVRGVRILPPFMTDELRAEMNYYKQLALDVEEKLSRMEMVSDEESVEQTVNSSEEDKALDYKISNYCNQESAVSSTADSPDHRSKVHSDKINSKLTDVTRKTVSDDDETITNSTDINRYMNISDSSKTDVTETISEAGKPRVPKTLDIVPITVDPPRFYKQKSSSDVEDTDAETPKLVRQGSYTLDSPSPMLLAHLQHSQDDYVPTPVNGLGQKEWSVNCSKTEWTLKDQQGIDEIKNNPSDSGVNSAARRNSISVSGSNDRSDKVTEDKTDKQLVGVSHHAAKSVDCIQSMLSKELIYGASNKKSNIPVTRSKSSNAVKNYGNLNCKNSRDVSVSNAAKIYGGYHKSLSNGSSPSFRKKNISNNRMTQSFDASANEQYDGSCTSDKTTKPVITSEKLLQVFKEIQKTHHQQMAHLIARQQREQIIMQQEFEKQQLMLLEQLEKTCPGISLPAIIKKITTPVDKLKAKNSPRGSVSLPRDSQNRSDTESSPLNGSSFGSEGSLSINLNVSHDASLSECKISRDKKISSVSRQLFPLESKTTHIPIANGAVYHDRHVKAATIINAYARGYLVRRLMKTERIMTLKNTYREALHCMLKLHVDAPWELAELNFHKRLQHQCDAASMSIVELFSQSPSKKMIIISQDRQIKQARQQRPTSAKSSYSFATQRTLARKKFKEMGIITMPEPAPRHPCTARTRCQTWTSNSREKRSPGLMNQGIKRSTSAGAVRKPWR